MPPNFINFPSSPCRQVASSLRDTLSEEEEVALSEICWELEDSGEPENEQIAAGLLRLLGMK